MRAHGGANCFPTRRLYTAAAAGKVLHEMLRRELVQPRLRERMLLRLLSLLLNL